MNGIVSDDDDFKIPKDIKCPCIAQLQESSCKRLFICKPEFDRMESCMRKHPEEFGDEDIKMFEETVRSGFKFRDFLGFSRSLRKQNKNE
ncbi:hypothetical protein Gasu2_35290 [Galdieria sulphuraria]|nr:hypothetical protein Gasu2_35290 [Galdieria sulphuraria]